MSDKDLRGLVTNLLDVLADGHSIAERDAAVTALAVEVGYDAPRVEFNVEPLNKDGEDA